jgi:hypothetical protein
MIDPTEQKIQRGGLDTVLILLNILGQKCNHPSQTEYQIMRQSTIAVITVASLAGTSFGNSNSMRGQASTQGKENDFGSVLTNEPSGSSIVLDNGSTDSAYGTVLEFGADSIERSPPNVPFLEGRRRRQDAHEILVNPTTRPSPPTERDIST